MYPKLSDEKPLKLPKEFEDYLIEETPNFDTSCDEDETEYRLDEKEGTHLSKIDNDSTNKVSDTVEISTTAKILDRIRDKSGGIDLGLKRTDFGQEVKIDRSSRKMVNYDRTSKPQLEDSKEVGENEDTEYVIPFDFGDRGSSWRMIKLNKLGSHPDNNKILEIYSTMWDYRLACYERDEIAARRNKTKNKWVYKPDAKFMQEREKYVNENKVIVDRIRKAKEDLYKKREVEENEDDDIVINLKKSNKLRLSKNKRIKNELKLAHLSNLDEIDDFALSREQIESLTNSP